MISNGEAVSLIINARDELGDVRIRWQRDDTEGACRRNDNAHSSVAGMVAGFVASNDGNVVL